MPTDLATLRNAFADHLLANAKTRFSFDAALLHVCTLAYEQGLKDAQQAPEVLVCPESVTEIEVTAKQAQEAHLYGCHNRQAPVPCQHDLRTTDASCSGCKHRGEA